MWLECGIDKLSRQYTIATDLKLCNILLGLMSHSSAHPCCWCDISKGSLVNKGICRTIGSLMDLFWDFFDARADRKDAKNYGNVIHPNMFAGGNIEESTPIIQLIPPPELHLLTGPVNTMYDELCKVWPPCGEWIKRIYIKKRNTTEVPSMVNDSRKLLKNVKILEEIGPSPSLKVKKCIYAFKAFNDVVLSCYGRALSLNYKDQINVFRRCYKNLKISFTPKIHAVLFHIIEFCDSKGMGLSPWSEQASESVHHDFKQKWKNFNIRDTDHPVYGKRLLEAIVSYNSQHL